MPLSMLGSKSLQHAALHNKLCRVGLHLSVQHTDFLGKWCCHGPGKSPERYHSKPVGDMHASEGALVADTRCIGLALLCRPGGQNWVLLLLGVVFILLKYVFKVI